MLWNNTVLLAVGILIYYLARLYRRSDRVFVSYFLLAYVGRILISLFPDLTYVPVIGSLSINSVFTVFVALVGIVLFSRCFLLKNYLWFSTFVILIILLATVSATYNSYYSQLAAVIFKWLYFSSLCFVSAEIGKRNGLKYLSQLVLYPIWMLAILQVLSFVLGVSKDTESAVSSSSAISYIAGYYHESGFSFMLMIGVAMSLIAYSQSKSKLYLVSFFSLFILEFLANYRTTIMATLIIVLMFLHLYVVRGKYAVYVPIFVVTIVLSIFLSPGEGVKEQSRFGEIVTIAKKYDVLLGDPYYYDKDERALLSARLYIWNSYLYEYYDFSIARKIIGAGPESWANTFEKYAHNNFISYLYEYGILGFFFLITMLVMGVRKKMVDREVYYISSASIAAYGVLALSTMPLWSIEGLIMLSIFFGIKGHD